MREGVGCACVSLDHAGRGSKESKRGRASALALHYSRRAFPPIRSNPLPLHCEDGDDLNGPLTDQRPSISHSGLDIYFFSNRDGGQGGVDIWGATREDVSAPFGTPTNLGLGINTSVAEQHPFIYGRAGMEMLYFSRNLGTSTVLNLDLFVSTRVREGR